MHTPTMRELCSFANQNPSFAPMFRWWLRFGRALFPLGLSTGIFLLIVSQIALRWCWSWSLAAEPHKTILGIVLGVFSLVAVAIVFIVTFMLREWWHEKYYVRALEKYKEFKTGRW